MFLKNNTFALIFEFLLALSISVLPWSFNLNSVLLIILFTISFFDILFFRKELKIFSLKKTIFIIIPYLVFIGGTFWSTHIDEAIKKLISTLSFIIIPFIFIYCDKYLKTNYHTVFILFVFSCLFKFLFFFFNLLTFELEAICSPLYWKTILFRLNRLLFDHEIHPTYFSLFLGICIYLSFYLAKKSIKKWHKNLWYAICLVLFIIILAIMAKMVVIGLIISFFIISFISLIKQFNKKRLVVHFSGLLIIALSLTLYLEKIPNTFVQDFHNYKNLIFNKKIFDSYKYSQYGSSSELKSWKKTNRIFLWQTSLQVWKQNLLLGTGTGDYKTALNKQYLRNGYYYMAEANMNTHNQYLSYLVQYGIFGFTIILFCFLSLLYNSYLSNSLTFSGILLLVLFTGLTENILDRQWGIVSFIFFVCLFLMKTKKSAFNLPY